uniref:Cytochrome c oxidase assembly factor 3 n=1 Tax=Plectus sambesii TaxID=2011161 RepID=A0A914VLC3_9BILA
MIQREDRRPWYKRLFTSSRLDAVHRGTVFVLMGSAVFLSLSLAYMSINFYKYEIPLRREKREQLEKELIEADKAGF